MLTREDKEVSRKKELINEYYYHLIGQAVFYDFPGINAQLAKAVYNSMAHVQSVESSRKNLWGPNSEEPIAALEKNLQKKQVIFEKNVNSLLAALNNYLSTNSKDQSTKILKQKIEATRRLAETLDSKQESGEKLNNFYSQLKKEDGTLRQHRNKGWDIFFNTVCLFPFAPILSIFNRISYGTWNPKVTDGEEMIREAGKRNSY